MAERGADARADLRSRAAALDVVEVAPDSPAARTAQDRYLAELEVRLGFPPGAGVVEGRFLAVLDAGLPIAGGAVRTLPDGRAEVKRLWVDPAWRGAGLGARLLRALEDLARDSGHAAVVLDTRSALEEAVALYDRSGYRRIERYNDNPHAQLFFEKPLR